MVFTTGRPSYLVIALLCYAGALLLWWRWPARRSSRLGPAWWLYCAGLLIHALALLGRGWLGGVWNANPVFEGTFFIPWCLALLAGLERLARGSSHWGLGLVPALALLAFSIAYAQGILPPEPRKITALATAFFISEGLAYAAFFAGAWWAALALLRPRSGQPAGFHAYLVWGLVAFSIAQVVGFVWCYLGWGNTFRFSPRHLFSAGVWLLYAAYLHLRYLPRWPLQRRAGFAVAAGLVGLAASASGAVQELFFPRIGG